MGVFIIAGVAAGADPVENAVAVAGDVGQGRSWTLAQIKTELAKDSKTLKYTVKGENHAALVVPLLALVNAAAPKLDPRIKNHSLQFVVAVEGKDGYMATFALAELMPADGNKEAWVALDMDDKPLSDRDGPASLIVPTDAKPERWVHGIKTIRVVDLNAALKPR
jgi:hypothetical protein